MVPGGPNTVGSEAGDENNVALCLEGRAAVAAKTDEDGSEDEPLLLLRAARLWGAAEALSEKIEVIEYPHAPDRSLHERRVAAARERLDEQAWTQAWAEGRAMDPEEAVAYALEERSAAT